MEQCRRLFLQVLAIGGQSRQIGLGLAVNAQFLVDGFDLGRARYQALGHGKGRDLSIEPGDFRQGVLLGLPGRFQTRDRVATVLGKVGRQVSARRPAGSTFHRTP